VKVTLVAAVDENDLLGLDGGLPWSLPAELAHFRAVTLGRPVLMGRKTRDAIGRALPGRLNVVLSRRAELGHSDAVIARNLPAALAAAAGSGASACAVIGGAELFAEAGWIADAVILTRVHARIPVTPGQTAVYFPRDGWWAARAPRPLRTESHGPDRDNPFAWTVTTFGLGPEGGFFAASR
jgi:dihydrofolate reductase